MVAAFHNPPGFDHVDAVRLAHGGQAVGDDDGGAVAADHVQRTLDRGLGFVVHRAGGLVQDQDGRVFQNGARQGQALALPAR